MSRIVNHDIIAFGGRKESGKSELAKVCEQYGYQRISFATPLKKLICKLLQLNSIEALNGAKNKEIGHVPNQEDYELMAKETAIPIDYLKSRSGKFNSHNTVRDWLQIIGTDIIRNYDNDWHVKKTMSLINEDKCYVFDDVRFPNELEGLKNIGAECWFVIRPKCDNISHHPSEESLDMTMFDCNVIVNDGALKEMISRFDSYMSDWKNVTEIRNKVINSRRKTISDNAGKWFLYPRIKQLQETKESVDVLMATHHPKFITNGVVYVYYKDSFCYRETDPFRIEEMKRYM